jgi:hypothetical protein
MKYIAEIERSEQVSPDDWKLQKYALEIDRDTTLGQVEDWVLKVCQVNDIRREYFRLDVRVMQVDSKPSRL